MPALQSTYDDCVLLRCNTGTAGTRPLSLARNGPEEDMFAMRRYDSCAWCRVPIAALERSAMHSIYSYYNRSNYHIVRACLSHRAAPLLWLLYILSACISDSFQAPDSIDLIILISLCFHLRLLRSSYIELWSSLRFVSTHHLCQWLLDLIISASFRTACTNSKRNAIFFFT